MPTTCTSSERSRDEPHQRVLPPLAAHVLRRPSRTRPAAATDRGPLPGTTSGDDVLTKLWFRNDGTVAVEIRAETATDRLLLSLVRERDKDGKAWTSYSPSSNNECEQMNVMFANVAYISRMEP